MSFEKVAKRNGTIVDFDATKIEAAITKAGKATEEFERPIASLITKVVLQKMELEQAMKNIEMFSIEQIQDIVERVLFNTEYKETAKAYMLYRDERRRTRELISTFHIDLIGKYVDKADWKVKENSNTTYSLQGLHNYMSSELSSQYWLNHIYPKEIAELHKIGAFHIHDLGMLAPYCCGWDLHDLLELGFTGVPSKISSKPAKHLRTALGQLVNFTFTVQGEVAGAQAVSNFDTLLAPFVYYDKLSYKQVKQAIQEFVFNINVPTRVGFQCVPDTYECLTPSGWKSKDQLKIGEPIYVVDMETKKLKLDSLLRVNEYDHDGYMVTFNSSKLDFSTTLDHRQIRKSFDATGDWVMETSEKMIHVDTLVEIPLIQLGSTEFIGDEIEYDYASMQTSYGHYTGKVWCPTTTTGTFVCRTPQKVPFLTGNCPFFNLTMDLQCPSMFKDKPVMYDGNYQPETYGQFQNEMNMINKAFCEVMTEGDASGRIFSFPIPTYNIDKDFDWDNEAYNGIWRMAGKFGVPYFANFYGSDMDPEDVRSMCPLHGDTPVWIKTKDTGVCEKNLQVIYDEYREQPIQAQYLNTWVDVKIIEVKPELFYEVEFEGEEIVVFEGRHEQPVKYDPTDADQTIIQAKDITKGMWLPFNIYRDGCCVEYLEVKQVVRRLPLSQERSFCFEVQRENLPYFELANGLITHNCRLRIDNRELIRRGGGLFGSSPKTGSLNVVTINLARLGYESISEDDFKQRLTVLLEYAKETCIIKRKVVNKFTDNGMYPYAAFYLKDTKLRTGSCWTNHFNTIGINGMNEACLNLFGKEFDIGTEKGKEFAVRVMDFIREKLVIFQEETNEMFNLEATPAESTAYTLALKDRKSYPDIISASENDDIPFYTNSTHLPVNYTHDVFELLDLQDELQTKYTGGTVIHLFLGEEIRDPYVAKTLVRKVCENYKLPYFSLTPTFSTCDHHGYLSGEQKDCPHCGGDTEIYSRVVGYYRPTKSWNESKQIEFDMRKTFKI